MKPYRPSSGTEGMCFDDEFCSKCKKDHQYRIDLDPVGGCNILADTFIYYKDDPKYPKEWISDDDGNNPRCTAFVDINEPDPIIEDTETLKLFEVNHER